MGGNDSQKLLPWSGIALRFGAQQTSGFRPNQRCNGTVVSECSISLGQPNLVLRRSFYVFHHEDLDWNFPQP